MLIPLGHRYDGENSVLQEQDECGCNETTFTFVKCILLPVNLQQHLTVHPFIHFFLPIFPS